MYQGSIAPVSNREDWIVISPLIDDDGTEVVLTGATIEVWVCQQGFPRSSLLSGSTVDGKITLPTTTTFQWAFTPDDMGVLCAGTYDLFLRVTISSITTQVMAATLPIVEGGPS
jgi:hypothetical protein